jgi:hypothetical protein
MARIDDDVGREYGREQQLGASAADPDQVDGEREEE